MSTTAGQVLVNDLLPPALRDYSRVLDGKSLPQMLRQVAEKYPEQYRKISHQLLRLGSAAVQEQGGYSFGSRHLRKSEAANKIHAIIQADVQQILRDPRLTPAQKNEAIVVATGKHSESQQKQIMTEAIAAGNPLAKQVLTGARGKPANLVSLLGGDLLYTDHRNNVIPIPVLRSYSQGLSPAEYWCLSADTLVKMADGSTRLIVDIKPGEWVIGADSCGATFPVRVVANHDNGVRLCRRYQFRVGQTKRSIDVVATAEHKILATSDKRGERQLPPRKVTLGDVASAAWRAVPSGPRRDFNGVAEPRAAVLGLLLGDRYLPLKGSLVLTCADDLLVAYATTQAARIGLLLRHRAGLNYILGLPERMPPKRKGAYCTGGSRNSFKLWLDELELLGCKAPEKFIPSVAHGWDNASVAALLSGLFATDGSVKITKRKTPIIKFHSTSLPLIQGVVALLADRFGIHAGTIGMRKPGGHKIAMPNGRIRTIHNAHPLYTVEIAGIHAVKQFYENIGIPGIKGLKLATALADFTPTRQTTNSFYYQQSSDVGMIRTCDLEVDHPDHLFVLANGMVVSNSGTYGARKGIVDVKQATANAGFFCLAAGTLVRMADGSTKTIESIKVGDYVLGADKAGKTFAVLVTHCFDNGLRECLSYRAGTAVVECTEDHKFLAPLPGSGRLSVEAAKYCDWVHLQDGSEPPINPERKLGLLPTYDIEVDHPDHLFVLANGAIVSNSKQIVAASHRLMVAGNDSGVYDELNPRGLVVPVSDADNEGALLAKDFGPYKRNTPLTPRIQTDLKRRGFSDILIRSPIIGGSPEGGVYAYDVGVREDGKIPGKGEFVGIQSASALSEPISQGMLCLAAGTLVRMADGDVAMIDTLCVGDYVLGADRNGHTFAVEVTAHYDNGVKDCQEFIVDGNVVICTPEHKILSSHYDDGGYVQLPATSCRSVLLADGRIVELAHSGSAGQHTTYDIEVDHLDHLFVLANDLIVSNSSKHSGGVAGQGQATGGFAALNALIQIPQKMPGGAAHATEDGPVESIKAAPAGGNYITIGGKQHYVPAERQLKVKLGDVVEAGDVLSTGLPSPSVVTQYKGIGEGRRYFTEIFRDTLKSSGITAHRRNVEMLARGLLNHVQLTEETENNVPDDIVPYSTLEHTYQPRPGHAALDLKKAAGKYLERPVLHYTIGTKLRPSVLHQLTKFGIKNVLAHDDPPPFQPHMVRGMYQMQHDPDFLVQMYGSGLKKSLLTAVSRGGRSDLDSSSFVPSFATTTDFGADPTRLVTTPEKRQTPEEALPELDLSFAVNVPEMKLAEEFGSDSSASGSVEPPSSGSSTNSFSPDPINSPSSGLDLGSTPRLNPYAANTAAPNLNASAGATPNPYASSNATTNPFSPTSSPTTLADPNLPANAVTTATVSGTPIATAAAGQQGAAQPNANLASGSDSPQLDLQQLLPYLLAAGGGAGLGGMMGGETGSLLGGIGLPLLLYLMQQQDMFSAPQASQPQKLTPQQLAGEQQRIAKQYSLNNWEALPADADRLADIEVELELAKQMQKYREGFDQSTPGSSLVGGLRQNPLPGTTTFGAAVNAVEPYLPLAGTPYIAQYLPGIGAGARAAGRLATRFVSPAFMAYDAAKTYSNLSEKGLDAVTLDNAATTRAGIANAAEFFRNPSGGQAFSSLLSGVGLALKPLEVGSNVQQIAGGVNMMFDENGRPYALPPGVSRLFNINDRPERVRARELTEQLKAVRQKMREAGAPLDAVPAASPEDQADLAYAALRAIAANNPLPKEVTDEPTFANLSARMLDNADKQVGAPVVYGETPLQPRLSAPTPAVERYRRETPLRDQISVRDPDWAAFLHYMRGGS